MGASAPLHWVGDPTSRCTPRSKAGNGHFSAAGWAGPRNASGYLTPEADHFPNGIKAVVDYVHLKNLSFGLYTCSGVRHASGLARSQRRLALWGLACGLLRHELFSSVAADHMCGRSPGQLWALAAGCRRICRVGRGLGEAGTILHRIASPEIARPHT
jgi:hypothetical protein